MHLSVLEAAAGGLLQGVAVIFPISGLGHGVLIGSLGNEAGSNLAPEHAEYLYAPLRLAIGLALFAYFWRDWVWVGRGLLGTASRRVADAGQRRWAWKVVAAVVPSSIAVAVLARRAHALTGHPRQAAACLGLYGLLLLAVWWWFRRSPRSGGLSGTHRARMTRAEDAAAFADEAAALRAGRVLAIGWLPVAGLVPGLSAVGLAICAGLLFGLSQEQAARVALLMLTPVLLVWGLRELPDFTAEAFDEVRVAVLVACGVAALAAYLATSLLVRYFRTASLRPFGYYCLLAGAGAFAWLAFG